MHVVVAGCLALAALATFSHGASAAALSSRYTPIDNVSCRFDPIGTEPGDEESQTKRCPGLGGVHVIVNVGGTTTSLGLEWPALRSRAAANRELAAGWSLGEKLEWRGFQKTKGFVPQAAILRVLFNREGSHAIERQVLAVIRVRLGRACLMGAVDMTDDKTPNERARALADGAGRTFVCGRDRPMAAGPPTEWTARVLASSAQ